MNKIFNIIILNSSVYIMFKADMVYMGTGLNCTKTKLHENKIARRKKNCTKTILHQGSIFLEGKKKQKKNQKKIKKKKRKKLLTEGKG